MEPISNVQLNKSKLSNICLHYSDSPFLPKTPDSLNKNTARLSDRNECGAEINIVNTTTKTITFKITFK